MHGEDKESQRRGTERGGEGRMARGGDREGELTGGHPSNLLSIFPPPGETQRGKERMTEPTPRQFKDFGEVLVSFSLVTH